MFRKCSHTHTHTYIYIYIYTRVNPCIKCTEAAVVLSDVVLSSSNDIGFLSGCIDVLCTSALSLSAMVLSFVDGCVGGCVVLVILFVVVAIVSWCCVVPAVVVLLLLSLSCPSSL